MSPTQTTIGAIAIALPILGFGVAPRIFVSEPPAGSPFCEETAGAPAVLNGEPAIAFRLCDSPYLIVVPGIAKLPAPSPPPNEEEMQFYDSPRVQVPGPMTEEFP